MVAARSADALARGVHLLFRGAAAHHVGDWPGPGSVRRVLRRENLAGGVAGGNLGARLRQPDRRRGRARRLQPRPARARRRICVGGGERGQGPSRLSGPRRGCLAAGGPTGTAPAQQGRVMRRRIWIIADDYGLSPAVDAGILALLDEERLSGTGCMTVFPDWFAAAARLRPHLAQRAVGLHLTLTDHPALTGRSPLAPGGRPPRLAELLMKTLTGRLRRPVADELDAQWHRFEAALGVPPAFLDGHHHVHFLPPVRAWLPPRGPGVARP